MVMTAKWPMEPAHTSVGVMAPVRISRPRNSRAHQPVLTVSHRYRVGMVTASTRTPRSVSPLTGCRPKPIRSPRIRAIPTWKQVLFLHIGDLPLSKRVQKSREHGWGCRFPCSLL